MFFTSSLPCHKKWNTFLMVYPFHNLEHYRGEIHTQSWGPWLLCKLKKLQCIIAQFFLLNHTVLMENLKFVTEHKQIKVQAKISYKQIIIFSMANYFKRKMIIQKWNKVIFRRQTSSDSAVSSLDSNLNLISVTAISPEKQCL